jgi:hypothetical protein
MNSLKLLAASSVVFALFTLQGCASQTDDGTPSDGPSENDIKQQPGGVSGENAQALMSALMKVNAPSNTPPGVLGVGSRVARLELTTAQGGIAHFISQGGQFSSLDGNDLGSVVDSGVAWKSISDALTAGGLKWDTTQGEHGASSSKIFAKIECHQVVSPSAKPSCVVSPIVLTAADSATLMHLLMAVDAPSNTPPGLLGVGSRIGKVTLTYAQGGIAKFISENMEVSTLAGKELGDIAKANTPWADVRTALLDGTAVWKTTNGQHGASSSTIVATVECKQVVAPSAKPSCTVMPDPQ